MTITFSGRDSEDPDGSISAFKWTLDGAAAGTQPELTHEFDQEGEHTISLVVTDNEGADSLPTTSHVSVRGVSLPVIKLSGTLAWDTSVFRAELTAGTVGIIRNLNVVDPESTGGSDGSYTGFDLDAIKATRIRCDDTGCLSNAAASSFLNYSGITFVPGAQRPTFDNKLAGTDATGTGVDATFATLEAFDGAEGQTAANPFIGFLSLGLGGIVEVPVDNGLLEDRIYVYVGEVDDSEGPPSILAYGKGVQ